MADIETAGSDGGEIRTIHISNLPDDVKAREIALLCRCFAGFEGGILENSKGRPMAFALFDTAEHARAAASSLDGAKFDPDTEQFIAVRMARSNTKKRGVEDGRVRSEVKRQATDDLARIGLHAASYAGYDAYGHGLPAYAGGVGYPGASAGMTLGPPCTTLFVTNVPPGLTAQLDQYLQGFAGFVRLKEGKGRCCFVEFRDLGSATRALGILQGFKLDSNSDSTLTVQYARSQMKGGQ